MTACDILVDRQGAVASVRLRRPPHNYFDMARLKALADALAGLSDDTAVRCAVLASEGASFCAGAQFRDGEAAPEPALLYAAAKRIIAFPKPLVAAVQGPAIGGGLGLALAADIRIAAAEARFAANFVKIGISPGFGLTATLPRLVGVRAAQDLMLSGRRVDGAEALAIGLVDELAPLESLDARAFAVADAIAANAPLALIETKRLLRLDLLEALDARIAAESEAQSRLFATADHQEGIRAVRERRTGNWTGA